MHFRLRDHEADFAKFSLQAKNNVNERKKYDFILSKIKAETYVVHNLRKRTVRCNGDICSILAHAHNLDHIKQQTNVVRFSEKPNILRLLDPEHIGQFADLATNPWLIKQGTPLWLEMRGQARVTGSTVHSALGLRGRKEQEQHLRVHIRKLPRKKDKKMKFKPE